MVYNGPDLIPEGMISLRRLFKEYRRAKDQHEGFAVTILQTEAGRELERELCREIEEELAIFFRKGELVALVQSRQTEARVQISPEDWLFYEFPTNPFRTESLWSNATNRWSRYDGRTPFIAEATFRKWLSERFGNGGPIEQTLNVKPKAPVTSLQKPTISIAQLEGLYSAHCQAEAIAGRKLPGRDGAREWAKSLEHRKVPQDQIDKVHRQHAKKHPRRYGRPKN